MARIEGNLWEYNFAKVVLLDVSSDYELMQTPMPTECYPVLEERWMMRESVKDSMPKDDFVPGYLYDWHEVGSIDAEIFVGVVRRDLA